MTPGVTAPSLLRIREAEALDGFWLRLRLTDGSVVERDLSEVLTGPVFRPIRDDPSLFRQVRVENETATWPNGADICPDVLIWGGPPPRDPRTPARSLRLAGAGAGDPPGS